VPGHSDDREPLCTSIEAVDSSPEIERETQIFDAFVEGDTLDVIAVRLGIPYVDCANAIRKRIEAASMERQLLPELEAARISMARKYLLPAVKAGDVAAAKEYRQQGESLRDLFNVGSMNSGPVIEIAFAFGPEGRVPLPKALPGSGEDDLRPSPDSVDRDRNEDGQDGGGECVDLGRDRAR
jgi:hypothetical protein